jgi:hypothetical protein
MTEGPDADELVAIVAAYVIAARDRRGIAAVPEPLPAWRLAARIELDDAAAARDAQRRSAWRTSIKP